MTSSLSDADRERVDALLRTNLHYVGKAKLEKMSDAELDHMLSMYVQIFGALSEAETEHLVSRNTENEGPTLDKDVVVETILKHKDRRNRIEKRDREQREQRTRELEGRVAAASPRSSPTEAPARPRTPSPLVPAEPSGAVARPVARRPAWSAPAVPEEDAAAPAPEEDAKEGAAAPAAEADAKENAKEDAKEDAKEEAARGAQSALDFVADLSVTRAPTDDVFVKQPTVKIVAFNVLKLQMNKAGIADQWLAVVATFATFDIVVMQEIPNKDETMKRQIAVFSQILAMHSDEGVTWDYRVSEPSGPNSDSAHAYKERHAVFVRSPARIVAHRQWERTDDGVRFDYEPLTVLVESPAFEEVLGEPRVVVSSVHLPPSSGARREARDRQLRALLQAYPLSAEARLDTAFSARGGKDAGGRAHRRAVHMLMGDFNVAPQLRDAEGVELYGLEKNGWAPPLVGKDMATSSGRQCFDNMIMDAESHACVSERAFVHAEVLELAFFQKKGTKGVSDHSPVAVAFKKAPMTKRAEKAEQKERAARD